MPDPARVFVHIGLPKTGTTYLQRLMASNRRRLANAGVHYPGRGADHFLAAQDLLGRPFKGYVDPRIQGAWPRLVSHVRRSRGDVVISHELLATARSEEIARVVNDVAPRPVTVIATVRDLVRQAPAVWQEDVKNGSTRTFDDFLSRIQSTSSAKRRLAKPFWRFQDAPGILAQWSAVPGVEVVVVTVPQPGQGPTALWERFAHAIGVDPDSVETDMPAGNVSLGAAETEFLRTVNTWAGDALDWPSYRRLVKKTLAEDVLAQRSTSPRLALPTATLVWASEQSIAMANRLETAGYTVVGSLDDLRGPHDASEHIEAWPPPETDQLSSARDAVIGLLTRLAEERPS
jgi:hypothetical protein